MPFRPTRLWSAFRSLVSTGGIGALAVAALSLASCSAGNVEQLADDEVEVHFAVRIEDPASGLLEVRATIALEATAGDSTLTLQFRDLHRRPAALKELRATSNGRLLPVGATGGGDVGLPRIDLRAANGPIIVEYVIDPTFHPPGSGSDEPGDARSRIAPNVAVVRTASALPVLDPAPGSARVTFELPVDWVAVTPWQRSGDAFRLTPGDLAAVDYIGLGPFELSEVPFGETAYRIAAPHGTAGFGAEQVAGVVAHQLGLLGPPPSRTGPRSVIIVPAGFMRGGAAGNRSIVQGPSAVVLAHEVFHTWTHADLALPEARWFTEGLTNWYGIRTAREAGLITEEAALQCLADLAAEMHFLESDGARSLASVSRDYTIDSRAQRLVYSKGTLFARYLDRELAQRDHSLDEAVIRILSRGRQRLSNADFRRLFIQSHGEWVASVLDGFVEEAAALPEPGLGPAPGNSGCARYLPDRGPAP